MRNRRLERRDSPVLRHPDDVTVFDIVEHAADQANPHREKFFSPERGGIPARLDPAPFLRRDRAGIGPVVKPIDGTTGDGVVHADRPLDRVTAAVTRKQRGMIVDRAEASRLADLFGNVCVIVSADDEVNACVKGARHKFKTLNLLLHRPPAERVNRFSVARPEDRDDRVPGLGDRPCDGRAKALLSEENDLHFSPTYLNP